MALTPQQRLDTVLKIICPADGKEATLYSRYNIADALRNLPSLPDNEKNEIDRRLPQIIDQLVEDKYITFNQQKFDDLYKEVGERALHYYIITFKGEYFISPNQNGYQGQNDRDKVLSDRIRRVERISLVLAGATAVGALGAFGYYLVDLYWRHGWFQSRFWWTIFAMVVVVSSLVSYLIYRMLPPKKQRKE